MHYDVYGDGEKTVVLLHGWGADGKAMLSLLRSFRNFRAIVPDFYGFGLSPHPQVPLSLSDYVVATENILQKEGVTQAVVVGHSFGGRVAIKLGAKRADLVKGLVLVDSAGIKPRRTLKRVMAERRYRRAKRRGEDVSNFGSEDYRRCEGAMRATFVAVVNEDLKGELPYIKCPTLVLVGERDGDTPPSSARIIARNIKNSRLVVVKGAGHFCYLDAPNAVKQAIADWQEDKLC